MKSKLLLYFDTNIIIPVSCDASGRTHETKHIYYSKTPDASLIEIIQNFYKKTTGVNTIDTHFVFAETLKTSFKKHIIHSFFKEGIIAKSFTTLPSLILTDCILKQTPGGKALFGENVVIIYSNDDSLRLTGTIYDGNVWQWNVSNKIIPKVGNSPLKRSLIESLIDERDKQLGAIDERNREREIEYQMQFANDWLTIYKKLDSKEDLMVDFKFSFEDTNVKLRIPKREIELSYEKTIAPAISSIAEYKEKKCSNSLKYAIFVGPAFEEENFTFKIKTALECHEQFSVIPYSRLSLLLAKYLETCDDVDDFTKFDQISAENEKLYKNSLEWIQYAQVLTEFNENLNTELKELSMRVANDAKTLDAIISATSACLEKSAFDEAKDTLKKIFLPSVLVNNAIQATRLLLAKKENMEGIFSNLEYVDGARQLIKKIQDNSEKLKSEIEASESHMQVIAQKEKRIVFCENHYDEYLDLKREFNNASDYKKKKELVLKMKEVSDEPMPALKLRQVLAEIKYTKERVKIGLFKKKDVLHISVVVKNNETLPCNALLNISNKVQIRASEGDDNCIAFEIDKGKTCFSETIESTNNQLDFTKPIHCYLFVAKNVLDKSAIKCDSIVIK